jgi:hypothetical protein
LRLAAAALAVGGLALAAAATPRSAAAADLEPPQQLTYRPPATEERTPPRKGERALLEYGLLLAYENAQYWISVGFVEDWQFKLTWDDQQRKYLDLDGVRFDSNGFSVNWTHAFAGGIYYSLGRINNLGVKESFLLAAVESLYWESVVEWREVFSVNDTIMTDFGALSIGEPWFQVARYLVSRENRVTRALGFIHPLLGVHALLDPASLPNATESQTLPGYGVSLVLGAASTDSPFPSDSGTFLNVGLRSRLALAPGYTAPGTQSRQGWEVLSSRFLLTADLADGDAKELDFSSGAVFYGRLERNVAQDGRGAASIIGVGSAYTLYRKAPVTYYDAGQVKVYPDTDLHLDEPRDFRDKYSIIHLLGPVYEGFWRGAALGFTWAVEAYPDFAMVNPYALNAYSVDHDLAGSKTTQLYYGYYYGYGGTVMANLEATVGPVTLGAAAAYSYHESIEGLDRYEDDLTADIHAKDTWFRWGAHLAVPIPGTPLGVEATARWSSRRGTIGDTVVKATESRYSLGITCRL